MNPPEELQYTAQGDWVRLEGAEAVVGVTDALLARVGTLHELHLPKPGKTIRFGDHSVEMRGSLSHYEARAPITGTITAVNEMAASDPARINSEPYRYGWLYRMRVEAGEEIEHLLDAPTYQKEYTAIAASNVDSP